MFEADPVIGGAESGALSGDDLDLEAVIQAWAELPESVKDTDRAMPLCKAG